MMKHKQGRPGEAHRHGMSVRRAAGAMGLALVLLLTACGGTDSGAGASDEATATATAEATESASSESSAETAATDAATAAPDAEASALPDFAPDFTYEFIDETYDEDGRKIVFPQLVNANDTQKADLVNDVIQEALKAYLLELEALDRDGVKTAVDLSWTSESFGNNALTVIYSGTSSVDGALYPQHVYRTTVINLVEPAQITLADAFNVGEDFAARFCDGMYAPLRDDLDLEAANADIPGILAGLGSKADLAKQLADPATPFILTTLGMIASVPVPHAVGDHLEMAITYEAVEPFMKRDTCSVWTGYLAMSDNAGGEPADSGFPMITYQNARFGYSMPYPDIFEAPVESENGDGITLQSADGKVTLLIWAANNLEPVDGARLLEQTKESIAHIQSDWSADRLYGVTFEGGDADPIRFVECGYAGDVASVHFRFSFPAADEEKYAAAIDQMTSALRVE